MKTLSLSMICGPKKIDEIMHAADVFEPWKRMIFTDEKGRAKVDRYDIDVQDDADLDKILNVVCEGLKKHVDAYVLATWIDGGSAWRDESCRIVSSGEGWGLFDDLLRSAGYPLLKASSAQSAELANQAPPAAVER